MVGEIFSGLFNVINQDVQAQRNRDFQWQSMLAQQQFNAEEAAKARAAQEAMYKNYLSPQGKLASIKAAGLSPALMFSSGGGISGTMPSASQASSSAMASGAMPGVANFGFNEIEQQKQLQEAEKIAAETDRLTKETQLIEEEIKKTQGEIALQAWSERQVFTISDSQLEAIENSHTWGWSKGESTGESKQESNSQNSGWTIGADVDVLNLIPGGKFVDKVTKGVKTVTRTVTEDKGGAGLGVKGGKTEGTSSSNGTSKSSSNSESKQGGDSHGETNSESHTRQVLTWPKIVDGKPAGLYMVVLTGDYSNIGIDLREKPFKGN